MKRGVNQTSELGERQWCDLSEEKTASAMGGWEARGSFQQKELDRTFGAIEDSNEKR